jgi:transcriptional regulator with XRE-family HTH domain
MPTVFDLNQYGRDLGAYVRRLRKSAKLTQEQLAEFSTLSADSIRRLEAGSFSPTLETMFKLAHGFGLSPGQLLSAFEGDAMTPGEIGVLGGYRRAGPISRAAIRASVTGISRIYEQSSAD